MCSEGGSDSDAGLKRALYGTWNRDLVGSFLPRVRAYSMPAVRGFFRLTESDEKLISYEDRDVARQMWRVRFRDILDKISGYDIARLQAPNRSTEGYPQYHGRKLNEKPFGDNSVINMSDIEYKRLVYAYEFWELARECAGLSVTLFEHTLYAEKGPLRAPEMDERMWLAWCQLQHQWTACKLFKRDTDAIVLPNGQRKYRWDDPPAFEFDAYAAHTCLQKYGGVDHVVKCKFVNQRRVPVRRLEGGEYAWYHQEVSVATSSHGHPQAPVPRRMRPSLRTQAIADNVDEPVERVQAAVSSTTQEERRVRAEYRHQSNADGK